MEKVKLHLGCGSVYLNGYINIDSCVCEGTASNNKLKDKFGTTFDKYYINRYEVNTPSKLILSDEVGDISDKGLLVRLIGGKKCTSIIAIQVLEHFPQKQAEAILKMWCGLVDSGGEIIISIPDMIGTNELYLWGKIDEAYYKRLIYGSQKNDFAFHKSMFTLLDLKKIFNTCSMSFQVLDNFHAYPAHVAKGVM